MGKAIYKAASLFNHSCRPNAHAYFLSRTLYLRTTHGVTAGCQLELSYGPQVLEIKSCIEDFWLFLFETFEVCIYYFGLSMP